MRLCAAARSTPFCDAHLRKGPGYGLIIEPCTEDEIRHVRQTVRTLEGSFDDIVRTVQLVGESIHADDLSEIIDCAKNLLVNYEKEQSRDTGTLSFGSRSAGERVVSL
jgi:hypothetical protein